MEIPVGIKLVGEKAIVNDEKNDKPAKMYSDSKGKLFLRVNPFVKEEKAKDAKNVKIVNDEKEETIIDKVKDLLDDGKLNKSYKKKK